MESSLYQKFENAKLLLFQKQLMFFGITATKFKWKASDLDANIEGCVFFDVNKKDELVDKSIHINKQYIEDDNFKTTNVVDIILHETMHVIHRHFTRGKNKKKEIWAVATDHVIDRTIKKWNLSKPYVQYNIIKQLDNIHPNCTEEEAYEWLLNNQNKINIDIDSSGQNGVPDKAVVEDQNGNILQTSVIYNDSNQSPAEQDLIDKEIDNFISDARAIHESMKDRGVESNTISQYLNQILKIEIPWETILRKAIKTNVIQKPTDRSWHKPNKFFRPLGHYLPGSALEDDKDGVGVLILHIDSSASMSISDLKKGCYVIMESLQYFEKIIVLVADIFIHQTQEFFKNEFNPFYQFIKNGIKGRGGTSHRDVFRWCQENIWNDNPDELSMFISFTDGFSDVEQVIQQFDWTKSCPIIFLSPSTGKKITLTNYEKVNQIFIK